MTSEEIEKDAVLSLHIISDEQMAAINKAFFTLGENFVDIVQKTGAALNAWKFNFAAYYDSPEWRELLGYFTQHKAQRKITPLHRETVKKLCRHLSKERIEFIR